MPIQTVEKTIGDHQIAIVTFLGRPGLKIKTRLFKLILPVVGAVLPKGQDKMALAKILETEVDLAAAFTALAESVEENEFLQLMLDLLSSTTLDGKQITPQVFDMEFAGNYGLAYQIAFEVVKANGFFDLGGIGSLLKNAQTQVTAPTKS